MIKLTLLVFVCTIMSTVYLQEIPTDLNQPLPNDNAGSQLWSLQNYQGQRRRVKPCPRRSNKNDAEEKWIPSYSSRITHPLFESTVLQPQALKNEEYNTYVEPNPTLTIESEKQNFPNRRSGNTDFSNEEDCIDLLETANDASLKTSVAESTALRIIQDCLKKKQNNGAGSSRRSMSNSDDSDGNNNFAQESSADSSRNVGSQNTPEDGNANQLTTKLTDPERNTGISNSRGVENRVIKQRICYACSTATNPSCWEPDNRTTIKYCATERSCVTKSFVVKDSVTIIRDCANTCEDSPVPGIEPKYKSCKLCHTDYCNAAISINSYNLVIVLIISFIKCTF